MKDNRLGGIALIIGAITGVITMILHPVTGGSGHRITPAQFETLAAMIVGVHVLAIAGIPLLFLGALTLTQRLDSAGRTAITALVIYSLSLVAVLIAPAISGLVGTAILRKVVAAGAGAEQWRMLMDYNHMINQAFSQIYVVASALAIGLWSFMIVKSRALSAVVGMYGLLFAIAALIAMACGLALDVHGFGMIIFGEAIWLAAVGVLMIRLSPVPPTKAHA